MKVTQYIITRAWLLFIILIIGILIILLQINKMIRNEYLGIDIADNNQINTDVSVSNQNHDLLLVPTGLVTCSDTQTDLVDLRFKVSWTPNKETNLELNGVLAVRKQHAYAVDQVNQRTDFTTEQLNWIKISVVDGHGAIISLNGYVYVTIHISLNDPGTNEKRNEMINLLAGKRLFINFSFSVDVGQTNK
jgi:hypothetical protein